MARPPSSSTLKNIVDPHARKALELLTRFIRNVPSSAEVTKIVYNLGSGSGGSGGGSGPTGIDHGSLTGLADNDHPQYLLTSALPDLADHSHAGATIGGDGGNISANYVNLSGIQTITGKKTFPAPADGTNAPVFRGDSEGPMAALKIWDAVTNGTLDVCAAIPAEGGTMILRHGTAITSDSDSTLAALGTGLLKNTTSYGTLSIATTADFEAEGIATEEYVNNAVTQVINVATSRVLTVGTEVGATEYEKTRLHDSNPWIVTEVNSGIGLDCELHYSSIPSAPTTLWLRAYYNGSVGHTVTVQLWNYSGTPAWENYQVLPTTSAGYTFYSISIPDGVEHVSAGVAKVRFMHSATPHAADKLYVDYCVLVKSGQGSEKVDATRTWATKQTFPSDGTNAPLFSGGTSDEPVAALKIKGYSAEHEQDGTLSVINFGGGTGDCYLRSGLVLVSGDMIPVSTGGTGATTLAGAGITTFVGTPYNGVGLTGNGSQQTLLATGHAAGMYRLVAVIRPTTVTGEDFTILTLFCKDVVTTNVNPTPDPIADGAAVLTDTAIPTSYCYPFYSTGNAAIKIQLSNGSYTAGMAFNCRARLEYLGA